MKASWKLGVKGIEEEEYLRAKQRCKEDFVSSVHVKLDIQMVQKTARRRMRARARRKLARIMVSSSQETTIIKALVLPNGDSTTDREEWLKLLHQFAKDKYGDPDNSIRTQVERYRILVKEIDKGCLRITINPF